MHTCLNCFKTYEEVHSVCPHCGCPKVIGAREAVHLAPGTILASRYLIGLSVGAGGFGIVYKAWDMKLCAIVAVKEFFASRLVTRAAGRKEVIVNKKVSEEYNYRKQRFLAEARTMAKFGKHRSIPNVFEFFEENGTAYIVMELLNGIALNEYLIQNGNTLDPDFAAYITTEVANALKSLHDQKIIHRDVSPDNIFICSGKDMRIKLMDLGAAKLTDSDDKVVDIVLKPGYSPAEQYDSTKSIGPETDIYALGATLYMMLTGVKPIESTNRKINDTLIQPAKINPRISENINNTIMKAMAVEKHMRFRNIPEFLRALNGEVRVQTMAKEKKKRRFKRFSGIIAALIVLSVAAAFVVHYFNEKQEMQTLKPADISVWFSVKNETDEESAMLEMFEDFKTKFEGVNIDFRAIPEAEYAAAIDEAAQNGSLPTLFESTNIDDRVLKDAADLNRVLESEQAKECLFIEQYDRYYSDTKRIPLAIEVPVAYIITAGNSQIEYEGDYFSSVADFGADTIIASDTRYAGLLDMNFTGSFVSENEFLDNDENRAPVLLSSTMIVNEVRALKYQKKYVYLNSNRIYCGFTYEWSVGNGSDDEHRAAEMLLKWMIGNVYQQKLMVNSGSNGQIPEIPINKECFDTKVEKLKNLLPLAEIYSHFVFERAN